MADNTPKQHLASMAVQLGKLPAHANPMHSQEAMNKLAPVAQARVQAIAADPTLKPLAMSAGAGGGGGGTSTPGGKVSQTDPSGATKPMTSGGGDFGWGAGVGHLRNQKIRHVLLGIAATALTAGQANVQWKATPLVDFLPHQLIAMPAVTGTVSGIQSGVRPQYVNTAAEDLDMYQPLSYGKELALDAVTAAVSIVGFVTNGNATAAQTFYGCFIGEAVGKSYRPITSKLQVGSLGTSGSVAAAGTGSLTLTPLIEYTTRKILFTPGSTFSDAFIITSITCGIQNQLMSSDPIPASVFNDLYPLFLDLDRVKAAVPLTINYTNATAGTSATLKGTTRGDCDPADLINYGGMTDVAS